ncbi:MAG: ribosomal RNA small subunit methyltransferase A [Bacteroidetes bacterium]|nr:MAG: ribosomal RNA small subunit methyltransferase A [Bacteroidota bacterium]
MEVKAKKSLGQHFLKDMEVANNIARAIEGEGDTVLEIGPGMGVLTKIIKGFNYKKLYVSEVDLESIYYLVANKIVEKDQILGDFMKLDIAELFGKDISVIGNFPYNISSQIVFKTIDDRKYINIFAGMFQKEVAERICASPGSKQFGIISVMVQAYFDTEYLFTVEPEVFNPPPKVKSGVIRLKRRENLNIDCDEVLFKKIVKTTFNTRRKMLRVSLKRLIGANDFLKDDFYMKRPEQLSVEDFIRITNEISSIEK